MILRIGIDPGISGAVALLFGHDFERLWDMPVETKKSGRHQIDSAMLLVISREIQELSAPGDRIIAALEMTSAAPKQGVSGMFSMGDSFGCARMLLASVGAEIHLVAPNSWKKIMKLNKDKEYSRSVARRLYPTAQQFLERKKDHNRAEALLLARYLTTIDG